MAWCVFSIKTHCSRSGERVMLHTANNTQSASLSRARVRMSRVWRASSFLCNEWIMSDTAMTILCNPAGRQHATSAIV
eukprot:6196379-Pleurochrysis_carterae.AAC.4